MCLILEFLSLKRKGERTQTFSEIRYPLKEPHHGSVKPPPTLLARALIVNFSKKADLKSVL